jgi:quercetin dioxygenase-like cupin family protein
MPYIDPAEREVGRPGPGRAGRLLHSGHMTVVCDDIAPGSDVHPHHHPGEEIGNVIEGEPEAAIGAERRPVRAGRVAIVPGGVDTGARTRGPAQPAEG